MPRYFFDVTDIKQYLKVHTTISGIQRVSLEVIKQAVQREGADQVRLCVWDGRRKQYSALSSDVMVGMEGFDVDLLSAALFGRPARPARATPTVLRRYRNRPIKYQIYRMIAHLQAARGKESYFAKRGSSIAEWQAGTPQSTAVTAPPPKAAPIADVIAPGDQLIVLGATWGMSDFDDHLQMLKDRYGVEISIQVHDLIPLVMPQHLVSEFSLEFYRWLEKTAGYCARYFVAAQNTRKDLEHFMDEIGQQRPITVIPFARKLDTGSALPAAQTLKDQNRRLRDIPQAIRNKTKVPYVLVVGTLESRKNLWRLVQAWDRLSRDADLEMPKLLLAGRQGWFNDDLMDWMRASGNLRGWVQFVDRPNDEELAYLYRNCLFTATVSMYEGWGLPIGESLGFGKTAVVADNSSMPEVGGNLVEYCNAGSISSIAAACRKLIADPAHRKALEAKIVATDLRGWDDVAADYIEALTGKP
ncbi:glycosyltransferase family 4 protein [Sulfitobacter mediterraneus]|uniref:glycosyltransferase family 4 protein n=1 Tax=Sulfitobacter mediterraneus TaxID=83219 RepID=UPI000EA3F91E|nr:glycosyltransferase family 1 protein [Sulfitobacter mediterraneus]